MARVSVVIAFLVLALLGIVLVWLGLITRSVLRWRHERGQPVYRRLPDGRLRFEWSVNRAYHSARRGVPTPAGPVPADVAPPRPGPDRPPFAR